jgi:hypothetical protein
MDGVLLIAVLFVSCLISPSHYLIESLESTVNIRQRLESL